MLPDISEFSYGFALTSELLGAAGLKAVGAPIFPSLKDEGVLGYDAKIQIVGSPIFLQFKLCSRMVRSSSKTSKHLPISHYRMHLRPQKHSKQHDLLMRLEAKGNEVYYAAPEFHLPEELNDAFTDNIVRFQTAFFRPFAIGKLPDKHEHFVGFEKGQTFGYLFSDPVKIERESSERLASMWAATPSDDSKVRPADAVAIRQVADEMLSIWVEAEPVAPVQERERSYRRVRDLSDARVYLSLVAQSLFGCAVFFKTRRLPEMVAVEA